MILVLLAAVMHRFHQMGQSADGTPAPSSGDAPATPSEKPATPSPAPSDSSTTPDNPYVLAPEFVGTDRDPEERQAISEEFQAVDDRSLFNLPREMPAYLRLVRWAKKQSPEQMAQRAHRDIRFGQYIQSPDKYRGQLVAMKLNVARVLKYDALTSEGDQLYEVWAWVDESRGWLYVAIVVDLPPGTPVGPEVSFQAQFVGYFYKLQGYHAAKSVPGSPLLIAPAMIGRLTLLKPAPASRTETSWFWAGCTLAVIIVALLAGQTISFLVGLRRKRREGFDPEAPRDASQIDRLIEEWQEQDEDKEPPAPPGPKPPDAPAPGPDLRVFPTQNESPSGNDPKPFQG